MWLTLANIGIGTIADKLTAAYIAVKSAQNDDERLRAEERVKVLEARRDVLVAEGKSQLNAIVRALLALPVALYYAKIFLWDKVLGWGATDPLSEHLTWVSMTVIGFYFVTEAWRSGSRKT